MGNRNDTFWLKLTSRHMAILCLKQMRKVEFGVCSVSTRSLRLNYTRYPFEITLHSLMQRWCTTFNIDSRNLLLLGNDPSSHNTVPGQWMYIERPLGWGYGFQSVERPAKLLGGSDSY